MDLTDKKILCELDTNCRTPLARIAKSLRINRNVVAYRIKNLEDAGIITKYICSINLGRLGYKTYKIFLKTHTKKALEKDFVAAITKNDQVIHFLKTEGAFDYSITVAVKNVRELDQFLMGLKNKFKDLIKDYLVNVVVYSRIFKLNKLLLDQKQTRALKFEKYSSVEKPASIDDKDKKILKELSQSANLSVVELASRTKLTTDIAMYRLKQLSKKVVGAYRVMLDFNKLGYYHYAILLRIKQATRVEEAALTDWCAAKKNVLFCTKRIGHHDFTINAAITDINDLNQFLRELKSEFGELIESYDTIINSKLLKLNYFPF